MFDLSRGFRDFVHAVLIILLLLALCLGVWWVWYYQGISDACKAACHPYVMGSAEVDICRCSGGKIGWKKQDKGGSDGP